MTATVLLGVAHGSRDPASQDVVRSLLLQAAAARPGLRVADAYVDNASPSVRRGLQALADDGVDDVALVPLLLTPASHSKTDVAGGALDPDANAQVAATARLLWEGRPWPSVDIAFASTTRPTVPEAVARLRSLGHGRVAVARYFLGPGYLPRLVEKQARDVGGVDVVVAAPVGDAAEIARLVLQRYDEALHGDIRMNCDVCLYRVAMPGREDAVGAVQEPHSHPEDDG